MTATEMFNTMVANGVCTREYIDNFFAALSTDTLENQEAMTLTPNDFGTEYTTVNGDLIKVEG
jgi:hypothetical protein